jgi:hypothetical protein
MTISEPPSVHDPKDSLAPTGPWEFLKASLAGGFSRAGLELLLAWAAFFLLSNVFWALHLRGLVGWSSLPSYWGELLTARDLWELAVNGGLAQHPAGTLAPLAASLAFLWFLWAGWRLQAATAGASSRFAPWCWGFLDALVLGGLPLFLLSAILTGTFRFLGSSGIQGLEWLHWVGGALVRLSCLSAFFLQWWLCRLGRAAGVPGWRMGGWESLGRHLADSFLRFWLHPIQWTALVLGGVLARTGLSFLALFLAWRWGGGSAPRVWGCLLIQLAVVVVNAWLLGWFLRVAALFWRHDAAVRAVIRQLQAEAGGGAAGSAQ